MIFDGIKFAAQMEEDLKKKINRKLKLAIWLDPDNVAGAKYVQKKLEMAKRLGVEVVINKVEGDEDGVMVQMPHPDSERLIASIDPRKDVDGLREDSRFVPATVRAVLEILNITPYPPLTLRGGTKGGVIVVGSKGMVGSKLVKILGAEGMDKEDFDPSALLRADVVISATGQAGLIRPEMVKEGVVAIDVGYPKGDFDADPSTSSGQLFLKKVGFFTPVPGGVGPVTVAMLFRNLVEEAR